MFLARNWHNSFCEKSRGNRWNQYMCTISYRGRIYWAGNFTQRSLAFLPSDYVFFETSSTTPYQIRRIEELNKVSNLFEYFHCFTQSLIGATRGTRSRRVFLIPFRAANVPHEWLHCHDLSVYHLHFQTPNGNVEAKVVCFYRRRDISSSLTLLADKHQSEYINCPWPEIPWIGKPKLRLKTMISCWFWIENLVFKPVTL